MLASRTRALVAVIVAGAVLWSGCGGSSKVSANSYVKSVCTAISTYLGSIKNRENQVKAGTPPSAPAQGRQILQNFTSGMLGDTEHALSELKSAGVPNISSGQQISSAIVNVFTQVKNALVRAQAQANQLPITSATAFKSAVSQYVSTFQSSLASVASGLAGLRSSALVTAAGQTPACQALGGA